MAAISVDNASFPEVLFARRSVLIALIIFVIIAAMCLLAAVISPADPFKMSVRARLTEPGALYWLGADAFGRDVASRLLIAGQASLTIGLGVAALSSVIGIAIGLVAGFFRRLDAPMSRLIDAMMAFPDILLAIALVSILGGSMVNVMIALSIVYAPRIARIVRASTLLPSPRRPRPPPWSSAKAPPRPSAGTRPPPSARPACRIRNSMTACGRRASPWT